jgi:hypothetical protein
MQIVTDGSVLPALQVCATEFWLRVKRKATQEKSSTRLDMGAPELDPMGAATLMLNVQRRF